MRYEWLVNSVTQLSPNAVRVRLVLTGPRGITPSERLLGGSIEISASVKEAKELFAIGTRFPADVEAMFKDPITT